MEKRYQIFVSSTYEDLKEARQEVIQSLLELNCIPAGMELFPAADDTQWDLIKKVIDSSDYYVLIIGGRYGSIKAKTEKSYTQLEYEYAQKIKKPIVAFLHKNPADLPAKNRETDAKKQIKFDAFREKAQSKMCRYWVTPIDLGGSVTRSIVNLIQTNPTPGWIRASTSDPYMSLNKNVNALKEETNKIANQLIPAYREENSKFLTRIEHQIGLAKRDRNMGLSASYLNTTLFDFKTLLNNGENLRIVMSDGNTWFTHNEEHLIKRFQEKSKTTTFLFVHPDSPMVPILGNKTKTDSTIYRNRIIDTISKILSISPNNNSVRILGHFLVPHFAAFVADQRAYLTLYMHASNPSQSPSGFEFIPNNSEDCYFTRLGKDVSELISESVDISDFAKFKASRTY